MHFIDTHAHLQADAFSQDWAATLDRAQQAGVNLVLLPGSDLADSKQALDMTGRDSRLVCAVGCHPHEAARFSASNLDELEELVVAGRNAGIVAIGEIGLDYHYDYSPRTEQQEVFQAQIELAKKYDLPMIIHSREATADMLTMIKQAAAEGKLRSEPGVFHCFSGSVETAAILLDYGFYLGFDGPVTFKNARKTLQVVAACPLERLLLETDSPYLAPVPYRGKRNEPAYIPLIAEKISEIKALPVDQVANITSENAGRLFQLH